MALSGIDLILSNSPYPAENYEKLRDELANINVSTVGEKPGQVPSSQPTSTPISVLRRNMEPTLSYGHRHNDLFYGVVLKIISINSSEMFMFIDVPTKNETMGDIKHPDKIIQLYKQDKDRFFREYKHIVFTPLGISDSNRPVERGIALVSLDFNYPNSSSGNKYHGMVSNKAVVQYTVTPEDTDLQASIPTEGKITTPGGGTPSCPEKKQTNSTLPVQPPVVATTPPPEEPKPTPPAKAPAVQEEDCSENINLEHIKGKNRERVSCYLTIKRPLAPRILTKFNRLKEDTIDKIFQLNADFGLSVTKFIKTCWNNGYIVFIDNGYRSPERQAELFIIGRYITPRKGAPDSHKYDRIYIPGETPHNYGFAVDLHIHKIDDLVYNKLESKKYKVMNSKLNKGEFSFKWYPDSRWTFSWEDKEKLYAEEKRKRYEELLKSEEVRQTDYPIYYIKKAILKAYKSGASLIRNVNIADKMMSKFLKKLNNNRWWAAYYAELRGANR